MQFLLKKRRKKIVRIRFWLIICLAFCVSLLLFRFFSLCIWHGFGYFDVFRSSTVCTNRHYTSHLSTFHFAFATTSCPVQLMLFLLFHDYFLMLRHRRSALCNVCSTKDHIHNNCVFRISCVDSFASGSKLLVDHGIVLHTHNVSLRFFIPLSSHFLTDLSLLLYAVFFLFVIQFPLWPLFVPAQMWIMWNSIY